MQYALIVYSFFSFDFALREVDAICCDYYISFFSLSAMVKHVHSLWNTDKDVALKLHSMCLLTEIKMLAAKREKPKDEHGAQIEDQITYTIK